MAKTGLHWRNIALCEQSVPLRTNYRPTMFQNCTARTTMLDMVIEKAPCACERHETICSDNCVMVNGNGNESSTAVELLWTDCLFVNNRLSNQSS